MKSLSTLSTFAALALWLAFGSANLHGAPAIPANPTGERYLFVVDKSSDMEKLQDATEATLFDLIGSGLYGQMRPGDTFGMWTFNKEVSAGKFSMQVWDPRRARQQATIMAAFLSGVEYEGSSSTKDVTEKIKSIVHSVSNVTVFIISDGDAPMKGTPFDKSINAEYKRQRKQRASAKRPFVTTLIARDGWIIDQSVTVAGTRIDLPPRASLPQPETPALVNEAKTNAAVSSPVVQAAVPPAPKPAPKVTIITKRPPETNAPAETVAAAAAPSPAATPSADTTVATAAPPAAISASKPSPSPAAEKLEVASQDSILAAASHIAERAVRPDASAPSSTAIVPQHAVPVERSTATVTAVPSSTIENVLARLAPEATPVSAREATPSQPHADPSTPSSATVTVQGVATPVVTSGNPTVMIAFGGLMLVAAVTLGVMVFRQRRPASGASLITESMERR